MSASGYRSHTAGSIDAAIWRLALPSIGGLLFTMLFNLVDAYFVGRLGPAALAAVTASAFLYWTIEAIAEIPTIGGRARVAHRVGGEDPVGAKQASSSALALAILLGVVALLVGLWSLRAIFALMNVESSVAAYGADYLGILFMGVHGLIGIRVTEGLLQGAGDARTPMFAHMGALLLNVLLDPVLIFGWGPIPAFGVAGAAAATVACQGLAALVNLAALHRMGLFDLRSVLHGFRLADMLRVARIGVPIGGMSVVFCLVYVGLTRIVAGYGTAAVAALGLGHRVESVNYLISVGFSQATGALVGQNLGAKTPERADATVKRSLVHVSTVLIAISAAMVIWPRAIAMSFIHDAATVDHAASYIRIAGIGHVAMGWWIVVQGAFGGAGKTLSAMLIVLPAILARLPISWRLREAGFAAEAVWWTISITAAMNGTLMLWWWFQRRASLR